MTGDNNAMTAQRRWRQHDDSRNDATMPKTTPDTNNNGGDNLKTM